MTDVALWYRQAVHRMEQVAPPLQGPRRALQNTLLELGSRLAPEPLARLRDSLKGERAPEPAPQPGHFPQTLVGPGTLPSFEALSEDYPDAHVPPLDRAQVDESQLTWEQLHWRRNGFLILPKFLPDSLIDAYLALRERSGVGLGGFENIVWEKTAEEIKALGCHAPLGQKIHELFGEELALNFTLTQFTSTERAWHQDDYLGPDELYGRYCAVWMALDDVHPDSGPFQFIPGSHRWPGVRGRLVREHLVPEVRGWIGLEGQGGHWAEIAESFTTPAYQGKIEREKLPVYTFHARRGDVLIWHGKLVHRGSLAHVRGMRRPSLICHYYPLDIGSGPQGARKPARYKGGGFYWPHKEAVPSYEALNADEVFSQLTDEQWRSVLLRSTKEPVIDGIRMPGFPDASTQKLYTSMSWEETLDEAFTFYKITRDGAARHSRPLQASTRLLDFGVGWGRIIRMFMKDIAGANLHGVDVDPNILRTCRELMPVGSYSLCPNDAPLDFEPASFDVVTAFSVFSHLSPRTHLACLTELHRQLKPGGILVLTTLSRTFLDECLSVLQTPEASDWHRERARLITSTFPDWERTLRTWPAESFFYLPAGGGFDWTGPEHYGWSMISREYAEKEWTQLFDIVEHIDDPKVLKQACFVLRKK